MVSKFKIKIKINKIKLYQLAFLISLILIIFTHIKV